MQNFAIDSRLTYQFVIRNYIAPFHEKHIWDAATIPATQKAVSNSAIILRIIDLSIRLYLSFLPPIATCAMYMPILNWNKERRQKVDAVRYVGLRDKVSERLAQHITFVSVYGILNLIHFITYYESRWVLCHLVDIRIFNIPFLHISLYRWLSHSPLNLPFSIALTSLASS